MKWNSCLQNNQSSSPLVYEHMTITCSNRHSLFHAAYMASCQLYHTALPKFLSQQWTSFRHSSTDDLDPSNAVKQSLVPLLLSTNKRISWDLEFIKMANFKCSHGQRVRDKYVHIVFRGKWLWSPANIKEANKDSKIYDEAKRSCTIFCSALIYYAWIKVARKSFLHYSAL